MNPQPATPDAASASLFAAYFPPNPRKHGRLLGTEKNAEGALTKRVTTLEPGPVTTELIGKHLAGTGPFKAAGYLPGDEHGTNTGMLDLDTKDYPEPGDLDDARLRLADVAGELGLHPYFEDSTRGGTHVHVFTSGLLPHSVMRQALCALAQRAQLPRTEVYPAGDDHMSTWYIMPCAGAANDPRRLGHTFLRTADGEPIPYDELDEWLERTPAEVVRALADSYAEPERRQAETTEPDDLAPEALEDLKRLALDPPASLERHGALSAFLNLGRRCGREGEMAEHLKSEAVRRAWVRDGSRDAEAWGKEVDRWSRAQRGERQRGIGYLREQGFNVPALPKLKPARPKIPVNGRYTRDVTADALTALVRANTPESLFVRGNVLARIADDKAEALTATSLKGILDRAADFVKVTPRQGDDGKHTNQETPAKVPNDVAPDILTLGALPFPHLDAIAAAPVALPGGVLLLEDGYNPEHRILLRLKGLTGLRADLSPHEAVALLRDVFGDFPFADEAGFAHILTMTLQAFVRPLISGPTPLYLIDAPARGTGKGLISEVSSLITLGYPAPVMSQPRDGDELEKRLTAALLEGRQLVFLDNVTELKSPHLAAAITAEIWQGRLLGKSELVSVPNRPVWLATGNNVSVSDEFARRIVPIRLDAGVERPEDRRGFRHKNLPEYVQAHRSELVSACLSLVQAWIDEGMPRGEPTLGRFEAWAGVMGGILVVSGVSGFLSGRERLYNDADSETKEWAALCGLWWREYDNHPVSAKDLFEVAKEHDLLLDLWGGRTQQGALQRIGHALAQKRDRVFGGYKILSAGKDGVTRSAAYRLEPTGNKTTETPEIPSEKQHNPLGTQDSHQWFISGFDEQVSKTTDKPPQNHRDGISVQHGTSVSAPGVSGVSVVLDRPAEKQGTPSEVRTLYGHWKAGGFSNRPDLNSELRQLFSLPRADASHKARLLELAREVG